MWIKILQLLTSLSLLVIIHELGHFMFAKLFKCRVEKFYLFFNPWFSLFKFQKGETEYGVGWLPLGGYVKIAGMLDESMDKEQLAQPPQPWEFRTKPAWQRLLIMIGGVAMNVVLAVLIYIGISWSYGETYIAPEDVKYGYLTSELAREMGFRDGDIVLNVDGKTKENYQELITAIAIDQPTYIEVSREGRTVRLPFDEEFTPRLLNYPEPLLTPFIPYTVDSTVPGSGAQAAGVLPGDMLVAIGGQLVNGGSAPAEWLAPYREASAPVTVWREIGGVKQPIELEVPVSEEATIGVNIVVNIEDIPLSTRKYTLLQAIPAGMRRAGDQIGQYVKTVKLIFTPKTEAYKSVGGFITIGKIFPDTWNWLSFWSITAFLSIILAVMNLLPIPGLDGGHVLFVLYEMIARRKPSEKFMEYALMVGFFFLIGLLLYANGNDIVKLFN